MRWHPGLAAIDQAWRDGMAPALRMHPAEWADRYRIMGHTTARPGPWRTDKVPMMREIMGRLWGEDPIREVVLKKGTQISGTEVGLCWLGSVIDTDPGIAMVVWPDEAMADLNSRTRLETMIEATPRLAAKVGDRARGEADTVRHKGFRGGELLIMHSGAKAGVRSTPVKFMFFDEVDVFVLDVGGQGDPCQLLLRRCDSYPDAKIFWCSSPTDKETSRIDARYELGDQRQLFVPCPHCHEKQRLIWEGFKWAELGLAAHDAVYICAHCGEPIGDEHKLWMLLRGEWRASVVPRNPRITSYHLPSWYSTFVTWGELAQEFEDAQGKPRELKVFTNTRKAETTKAEVEAQPWEALQARAEAYPQGQVPAEAVELTCGVDVQKDRVELEVLAWGPHLESWSVDYRVLPGSPAEPAVWLALSKLLEEEFHHAGGGKLQIKMLAIDEGGHHTDEARQWGGRKGRVMVCKGEANDGWPFRFGKPLDVKLPNGARRQVGGRLHLIGTSYLKRRLMDRVGLDPEQYAGTLGDRPIGLCHWPRYPEQYFQQLCAEALVKRRDPKGRELQAVWTKLQDRNEALDCRILNMAAAYRLGLHNRSLAAWEAERRKLGVVVKAQLELGLQQHPAEADQDLHQVDQAAPHIDQAAHLAALSATPFLAVGRRRRRGLRNVGSIEV